MDSQPSSSSGRPQRKRKPNSRFDIEDAISIPIKSQRRKTPASSQNSTFGKNHLKSVYLDGTRQSLDILISAQI